MQGINSVIPHFDLFKGQIYIHFDLSNIHLYYIFVLLKGHFNKIEDKSLKYNA
jgi:hypothetical protein